MNKRVTYKVEVTYLEEGEKKTETFDYLGNIVDPYGDLRRFLEASYEVWLAAVEIDDPDREEKGYETIYGKKYSIV